MAKAPSLVDKSIQDTGVDLPLDPSEDSTAPVYRVVGDSKLPVSKHMGKVWESRKEQGLAAMQDAMPRWDEAIRYYSNDQLPHRKSSEGSSGNTIGAKRLNSLLTETENVVFANCSIMVPMLYAKNPTVTFTYENDANEPLGKAVERLVNKLASMRDAPGVNLKAKMRRTVLSALLTNAAYIKLDWIQKQDSSETAMQQLHDLAKQLESAKDKKTILEIEGKIMALEESISVLSPSGPRLTTKLPQQIIVDSASLDSNPAMDANWMMEWDYLPTNYINAVYGVKQDNEVHSVYEPSHILLGGKTTDTGVEDEVNNFQLIKSGGDYKPAVYGYQTQQQLDAASYTKIWWVWDKTTRRVFLFADNNWKWPIWVWDDPLRLPRFFPYFKLSFHESVTGNNGAGEVTYYLDQQDAINEMNDEGSRARKWVRRNIFYDKNAITQDDVEAVLKGPDGTARGVKLPDGAKLNDVIFSMVPPSLKFPELFDSTNKFAAINRITGINDAMRGAQFKTNTTNQAVEAYQQNTDIRVDERIDLIEDFTADIMWNVGTLALVHWDAAAVAPVIGDELAANWTQVTDPKHFQTVFVPRVEGGGTEKPNSSAKKKQAVQLVQALGQFAKAAPALVIPMLKMVERAFDEVVISDEEWAFIIKTVEMGLQTAGAGPGGAGQEQGAPQQGGAGDPQQAQMAAILQKLPPQAQQAFAQAVKQGVPPAEALKEIMAQMQGQGQA